MFGLSYVINSSSAPSPSLPPPPPPSQQQQQQEEEEGSTELLSPPPPQHDDQDQYDDEEQDARQHMTSDSITEFKNNYANMIESRKWKVNCSQRFVENILFEYGLKLKKESCVHSFILGIDNDDIRGLFKDDELKEIQTKCAKDDPLLADDIKKLLEELDQNDANAVYDILKDSTRRYKDHDHKSIFYAVVSLFFMFESNPNPLKSRQLEDGALYDGCMGSKHIHESELKLPKSLKDMMTKLCDECNWNPTVMRLLEVVGYCRISAFRNHMRTVCEFLVMDAPSGYECKLARSDNYEVPTDIMEFPKLRLLLAM
ncbi:uncharacterized protein BX664DRAFT_353923 [Halteromyces radiatus]|uniref:uncharacterized protein n=1 Tax=Halteromyces radiatus TaxID=101107 RepID=UPI00221EC5C7|nr:uncharacterized protein BX664DRAFT_353923 [Halteromyces radiatus]KAI8076338.1 hypothetical protein BX664DRAFT_353923 [Halteromyces radiatus]